MSVFVLGFPSRTTKKQGTLKTEPHPRSARGILPKWNVAEIEIKAVPAHFAGFYAYMHSEQANF